MFLGLDPYAYTLALGESVNYFLRLDPYAYTLARGESVNCPGNASRHQLNKSLVAGVVVRNTQYNTIRDNYRPINSYYSKGVRDIVVR